jgi:two-component system nitrogen regulation response regulator GlnG/two-component system response regulator HydG
MPERPGLIGDADGSTLFLDEIGELPHELSTKLLRVLDEGGEYQRLGDSRSRSSKFRLVGATNRAVSALKADVAARFRLRISVPRLVERREDIPMLARHLLRRVAVQDPAIGERFFEGWNGRTGEPRISIELTRALVVHDYTTNIRELDVLLWASLGSSPAGVAELTSEVESELRAAPDDEQGPMSQKPRVDVKNITADDVRAALERAGGVPDKAWRDLGLANRHVLKRLVKKFGLRE